MARTAATSEKEAVVAQQAPAPKTGGPKAQNCVHHWSIESPNGRESVGRCKRCGAEKRFSNSNESVMWEQTNTLRNDANRAAMRTSKAGEIALADEA